MSKPLYRNELTGNYGVLEGQVFSSQSSYHQLKLLEFVDGMIELSDDQYENVKAENLVQVSREEVQRALRGFYMSGLLSRITVNPRQCGGRPCIRGMRIRVSDVLDLFAAGLSAGEILEEMPDLEADDLKASLLYASRKLNHPVLVA
jgi:Uncharacterized conserved protein